MSYTSMLLSEALLSEGNSSEVVVWVKLITITSRLCKVIYGLIDMYTEDTLMMYL